LVERWWRTQHPRRFRRDADSGIRPNMLAASDGMCWLFAWGVLILAARYMWCDANKRTLALEAQEALESHA